MSRKAELKKDFIDNVSNKIDTLMRDHLEMYNDLFEQANFDNIDRYEMIEKLVYETFINGRGDLNRNGQYPEVNVHVMSFEEINKLFQELMGDLDDENE